MNRTDENSDDSLIVVFTNGKDDQLLIGLIRRVIEVAAEEEGRMCGDLTVVLADDLLLKRLNNRYLDLDEPTDVLSFDMSDDTDGAVEGEIYISLERVDAQAPDDPVREMLLLVVHGFLHLCGYDHDDPAGDVSLKRMIRRGEKYVCKVLQRDFIGP